MFSECGWWEDVSISAATVWEQSVLARWVPEHFSRERETCPKHQSPAWKLLLNGFMREFIQLGHAANNDETDRACRLLHLPYL